MRQYYILIDSIETLQDLFLTPALHFEGVSLLLFKNSKNSCQSNAECGLRSAVLVIKNAGDKRRRATKTNTLRN